MGIGGILSSTYWSIYDIDLVQLNLEDSIGQENRNHLRTGLLISHLFSFLIPALFFLYFFEKQAFAWHSISDIRDTLFQIIIWSIIILSSYPIIIKLTNLNELIPIPDSLISSQEQSFILLRHTLEMNNLTEFLLSIGLIGFAAAIGEELIFRKIIQNILIEKFSNVHTGILLASIIFGLFHMQLERVIPLTFLGLILGYSYYITKNFLVPFLLHFLNNSLQVVGIYSLSRNGNLPKIQETPEVPTYIFIGSTFIVSILLFYAINNKKNS